MYAVGAEVPADAELVTTVSEPDPYSVLFVTEEAPLEVVKAARDALLYLHHPDHGGNGEDVDAVVSAYKKVCQLRGN
jgi:hypothetical protein